MNTLQLATAKPTSVMEQVNVYKVYQTVGIVNTRLGVSILHHLFTTNFWKACRWA